MEKQDLTFCMTVYKDFHDLLNKYETIHERAVASGEFTMIPKELGSIKSARYYLTPDAILDKWNDNPEGCIHEAKKMLLISTQMEMTIQMMEECLKRGGVN